MPMDFFREKTDSGIRCERQLGSNCVGGSKSLYSVQCKTSRQIEVRLSEERWLRKGFRNYGILCLDKSYSNKVLSY